MSSGTKTTADYIQHHLTNLTYGQLPDGSWGFAHSGAEAAQMGFWSVNVDSMVWSIVLGLGFCHRFSHRRRVGNSWRTRRPAKFC
jgi:F-type H+-transporting ATPase subunit a